MRNLARNLVAAFACAAMLGCTSMQVVADGPAAVGAVAQQRADGLQAHEHLLIVGKDGRQQEMELLEVREGQLVGLVDGASRSVPLAQVERIERRGVSAGKTIGLVVGVLVVVALAAARSIGNDLAKVYTIKK